MKLRFRTALVLILLSIVLVTVGAIGISSYLNARRAADNLASQILEQTSARIVERVGILLRMASIQGELTHRLLLNAGAPPDKLPTAADFPRLTSYFYEVMRAYPYLTFLSLGLEATGEYCHVERKFDGALIPQECIRNAAGKIERSDYAVTHGVRHRIRFDPDASYDPRVRPYYRAAVEAGKQVWTETYLFSNDPSPDSLGVTCATPIYSTNQVLLGVISADFNLEALCSFLKEIPVGRHGFAVVVEFPRGKPLQLIAHPDPATLIQVNGREHRLIPTDEIRDPATRALLRELTAASAPGAADNPRLDALRKMVRRDGRKGPADARFEFVADGVPYVGSCRRIRGADLPDWLICSVVPEKEIMGSVWAGNRLALGIGLGSLLCAALVGWRVSSRVARPLEQLARETESIGRLRLEDRPPVQSSLREIDRLAAATESMKYGLRSFQKYVPADLVRSLIASGREARLGGERRVVTVCFADIADFTTHSEQLSPEQLVSLLGENLTILARQILDGGGTVDKFMGDSVMAFWGAPVENPRHAPDACRAVARARDELRELHRAREAEGKPPFLCRFGIHTGEVLVGNVGSETRMNYTAIGNAVNLASRLEGLNKVYGTEVLLSEATFLDARHTIVARPLNWVAVKGRTEAVLVYELIGLRGEASRADEEFAELSTMALMSYSKQEWTRAIGLFEQALVLRPQDLPATMLMARCNLYQARPPGDQWDRVHRIDSK